MFIPILLIKISSNLPPPPPQSDLSQDAFTKSGAAVTGITAGCVAAGGIIGTLKEKFKPKAIPEEIINDRIHKELVRVDEDILPKIYEKDALTLKSAVNKLLKGVELTEDEIKFLNSTRLILPDDIKFLGNDKSLTNFIEKVIFKDISSNPKDYFDSIRALYPYSGLRGNNILSTVIRDRIEDFLNNGGKYSDNEEFLDYMTSRIYKDTKFKIATNKNGDVIEYVFSDAKGSAALSDKTYTYKEIIKHAKEHGKTRYTDIPIDYSYAKHCPEIEYFQNARGKIYEEAETKAKNIAINKFRNKQLLKSVGIGAAIVGALALCGSLIYNKVKKSKESDQLS